MNATTPERSAAATTRPAALALAALALAAALLASFAATARTQTAQAQSADARAAKPGYEFSAKRGDDETKIRMYYTGSANGGVWKVTATDADGTRSLKPVKPGAKLAQPCAAAERTCESVTLEDGRTVRVCVCKSATAVALLLPAVQKVREAAGGGGGGGEGGAYCTEQKPCCYEDQKLQMSVCYP